MTQSNIHDFAEQTLRDRVFMGNFLEKRYVNNLNGYQDVIVLDHQEKSLCDDFSKVKHLFLSANPNYWVSFTEPHDFEAPSVYCIWTDLDREHHNSADDLNVATTAFGEYWFQIKAIHFQFNAMELQLKILRKIETISSIANTSALSHTQQVIADIDTTKIQQYVQEKFIQIDWAELFNQWRMAINQNTYRFFSTEFTWNNAMAGARMIATFFILFFQMSVYFVQYMGEFTLKLIFELANFLRAATPILLAVINLIGKTIGGFYILFAMIWRDSFGGNSSQSSVARMPNYSVNQRMSIAYREHSRLNSNNCRPYQNQYPKKIANI